MRVSLRLRCMYLLKVMTINIDSHVSCCGTRLINAENSILGFIMFHQSLICVFLFVLYVHNKDCAFKILSV